jgi:hypothetical protein
VVEIYNSDTVYKTDDKSNSVSLDHNAGHPILSSDKFIFSRTIASKIFGKQRAIAGHTS